MSKLMNLPRVLKVSALALGLTAGAALVAQAMPHHGNGHGAQHGPAAMMDGGMMGGRGMGHLLEMVDASETQRQQIRAIMQAARKDLQPQHDAMRELRQQGMKLLSAPSIDAAAVEAQRQQMLTLHEAVSKRMSQAMIQAAQVLTPEQRAKLADRMAKRMARAEARMAERQQQRKEQRGQ